MTLVEAKCYIAVVETASMTKAAGKLHYTQPYISKIIAKAEDDIGVPLLDRDATPLKPTHAGIRYLDYCRRLVRLHQEMDLEFHTVEKEVTSLAIGVPPIRGSYLLPLIVPSFQERYPNIDIHITEAHSDVLPEYAESGRCDVVVFSLPFVPESIHCEQILDDRLLIMVPDGHPLHFEFDHQKNIPLLAPELYPLLQNSNFIVIDTPKSITIRMLNYLNTLGITCNIGIRTKNNILTYRFCEQGLGLAVAMEVSLRNTPLNAPPCLYQIGNPPLQEVWCVAWRKNRPLTPALHFLVELMKEKAPLLIEKEFFVSNASI